MSYQKGGLKKTKGDKGAADTLFSKIVRSIGYCERCGETRYEKLTTAHILPRTASFTRCMFDNALCLCMSCHRATEADAEMFTELAKEHKGDDIWERLRTERDRSTVGREKMDWADKRLFLEYTAWQMGLSDLIRKSSLETFNA